MYKQSGESCPLNTTCYLRIKKTAKLHDCPDFYFVLIGCKTKAEEIILGTLNQSENWLEG
jgi:hypothetical protein